MMSFLGALLLTGVAVFAVCVVLYFVRKSLAAGSENGKSFLGNAIGFVFSLAVATLPAAIFVCLTQGEGGVFAKTLFIFKSTVEVLKKTLEEPSVWEHMLAFAPIIVGGCMAIIMMTCLDDGDGLSSNLAPLFSFVTAIAAFVVALIITSIGALFDMLFGDFAELAGSVVAFIAIGGLIFGGGQVITITIKG